MLHAAWASEGFGLVEAAVAAVVAHSCTSDASRRIHVLWRGSFHGDIAHMDCGVSVRRWLEEVEVVPYRKIFEPQQAMEVRWTGRAHDTAVAKEDHNLTVLGTMMTAPHREPHGLMAEIVSLVIGFGRLQTSCGHQARYEYRKAGGFSHGRTVPVGCKVVVAQRGIGMSDWLLLTWSLRQKTCSYDGFGIRPLLF